MGLDGDDRLAQSHHRAGSRDLPRAALGAGRRLDAVRRIFQQRRAVSFLAAAAPAQAARAARRARAGLRRRPRDRVVSAARRRRTSSATRISALPALRGKPIATAPVEPGYSYHSESNMDLMQPVLSALAEAFDADRPAAALDRERVGPGPGRMHLRGAAGARGRRQPAAVPHRDAADLPPHGLLRDLHVPAGAQGLLLQRLASASVAGRRDRAGATCSCRSARASACRRSGAHFLAGLLAHAAPATAFATPTVNGYRRFRPNSLAPDRATWCYDHRGVMLRVLGAPGDPATRIENRIGEPVRQSLSLSSLSQIVAGLDGVDACARSRPAGRRALCRRAPAAADESAGQRSTRSNASRCSAQQLGDVFVDYFLKLKRNEAGRFAQWLRGERRAAAGDETDRLGAERVFRFFLSIV